MKSDKCSVRPPQDSFEDCGGRVRAGMEVEAIDENSDHLVEHPDYSEASGTQIDYVFISRAIVAEWDTFGNERFFNSDHSPIRVVAKEGGIYYHLPPPRPSTRPSTSTQERASRRTSHQ